MSSFLRPNLFKQRLKSRDPQVGFWINFTGGEIAEMASYAGFDWLLIDMEHTAQEVSDVVHQLRATGRTQAEAMVRVPSIDPALVKRVLDVGARSLMFPNVKTVEQAELAVAATRYAPRGIRGFSGITRGVGWGRSPDFFKNPEEDIAVVLQLESVEGIRNAEAIGNVEGVDGLFVGPADLSADAGHINNWNDPEVVEQIALAVTSVRKTPAAPGILCFDEEKVKRYFANGFSFIAVGDDLSAMIDHTANLVRRYEPIKAEAARKA